MSQNGSRVKYRALKVFEKAKADRFLHAIKGTGFFPGRTDVHWFPARTSERSTCNRQVIFKLFQFIVTFTNKKDRTITSPLAELSS